MLAVRDIEAYGDVALSVIVPTRNERGGIAACIRRLESSLEGVQAELIFVDDSDDGTDALILASSSWLPVRLIHREPAERRGGLAAAVLVGMGSAHGEYICVLDADLQHPPEKIPELLRAAKGGADIVVASRYVQGGSAGGLASRPRRLVSLACTRLARALFPSRLLTVSDPLSGFFVVSRAMVAAADLRPVGFKILLDILVRCDWSRVSQVPYAFAPRGSGASKATARQGLLFLLHLARLLSDRLFGTTALPSGVARLASPTARDVRVARARVRRDED